jgi:hypothetical protein
MKVLDREALTFELFSTLIEHSSPRTEPPLASEREAKGLAHSTSETRPRSSLSEWIEIVPQIRERMTCSLSHQVIEVGIVWRALGTSF